MKDGGDGDGALSVTKRGTVRQCHPCSCGVVAWPVAVRERGTAEGEGG